MSDSSEKPWSNNPYAPQISYRVYFAEKMNFAGVLVSAIFYGIVIVLFFRCMAALLDPVNRTRRGIKWGLVVHTAAMFSFVTIYTAANLDLQSISYIDNREFPGDGGAPPGPLGYQLDTSFDPIGLTQSVMFVLNGWLADGLLLYRCYITYAMSYWAIAFPCLVYLASFAMGVAFLYQAAVPVTLNLSSVSFGVPYYSISLSLNVLLTLMIVTRLVLHSQNVRSAMGAAAVTGGLYKAIVSMLVESCALYAVSYLLFLVPWALQSSVTNAFFPILVQTQVIAPLLIVLKVANQRATLGGANVAKNVSSLHFWSQGRTTANSGVLPPGNSMSSMDAYRKTPDEPSVGVTTTDLPHDKV